MLMLVLNETIDQLAVENSVLCCCHVLRRENGDVLWKILDFEAEGKKKKARLKMTLKR